MTRRCKTNTNGKRIGYDILIKCIGVTLNTFYQNIIAYTFAVRIFLFNNIRAEGHSTSCLVAIAAATTIFM
jgi:2-methylcitrate dehydratase PrpD